MKFELRFCESTRRFSATVFGMNLFCNGETVAGIWVIFVIGGSIVADELNFESDL